MAARRLVHWTKVSIFFRTGSTRASCLDLPWRVERIYKNDICAVQRNNSKQTRGVISYVNALET